MILNQITLDNNESERKQIMAGHASWEGLHKPSKTDETAGANGRLCINNDSMRRRGWSVKIYEAPVLYAVRVNISQSELRRIGSWPRTASYKGGLPKLMSFHVLLRS